MMWQVGHEARCPFQRAWMLMMMPADKTQAMRIISLARKLTANAITVKCDMHRKGRLEGMCLFLTTWMTPATKGAMRKQRIKMMKKASWDWMNFMTLTNLTQIYCMI